AQLHDPPLVGGRSASLHAGHAFGALRELDISHDQVVQGRRGFTLVRAHNGLGTEAAVTASHTTEAVATVGAAGVDVVDQGLDLITFGAVDVGGVGADFHGLTYF